MPIMTEFTIRKSNPNDQSPIETLYPQAFPEEDLLPLVRDLLAQTSDVLSLIAEADGIVGHVVFTTCAVNGGKAALLGPLAVTPSRQRQGIGGALIRDGLSRLERAGIRHVYVLGDPNSYARSGFDAEAQVSPPYRLPAEWDGAWQSIRLGDAVPQEGQLQVPKPWVKSELWLP